MLDYEMVEMIETMVNDDRFKSIVPTYLMLAKSKVVKYLFPMTSEAEWEDVPESYHPQVCEIAVYLINKRGAEGETKHNENGTDRTYEKASVPASMFTGMVPFAGVPR